jgi:hypothetical protein
MNNELSTFPSKNKKGLPKFNMPLEVWEGLVYIVEEMETHEQI